MGQFDAILTEVENMEQFFNQMEVYSSQIDESWKNTCHNVKEVTGITACTNNGCFGPEIASAKQVLAEYCNYINEAYETMFNNINQFSSTISNLLNYLPNYIEHLTNNKTNCINIIQQKDGVILNDSFLSQEILGEYVSLTSNLVAATYAEDYNIILYKQIATLVERTEKMMKKCAKEISVISFFCQSDNPAPLQSSENGRSSAGLFNRLYYFHQRKKIKKILKKQPSFGINFRKLTRQLNKITICAKAYNQTYNTIMKSFTNTNGAIKIKKQKMDLVFNYVFQQYPFLMTTHIKSKADETFRKVTNEAYNYFKKGNENSDKYQNMKRYSGAIFSNQIKKSIENDINNLTAPYKDMLTQSYFYNNTVDYFANAIINCITTKTKIGCFFLRIFSIFTFICSITGFLSSIACITFLKGEPDSLPLSDIPILVIISFILFLLSKKWFKLSNPFNWAINKAKKISKGAKGYSPLYDLCSQQIINSQLSKVEFTNETSYNEEIDN